MMRQVALYLPAAVIAVMAFYVWRFGRTDESVIVFLLVLGWAFVIHTVQVVRNGKARKRKRRRLL
jgi:hypothetical protein